MMRWLVVLLLLLPSIHARAEGVVSTSNFFFHTAAPSCNYAFPVSPPWSVGGNAYATCVKGLTSCTGTAYLNSNGCVLLSTAQGGACNDPSPNGICPSGVVSCPANSTGTTSCVCNTNYVPNAGATACVYVPPPATCTSAVGTVFQEGYFDLGTSDAGVMPATVCQSGCTANFDGFGSAVARTTINGVYHYYAKGTYSNPATSYDGSCAPNTPAGVHNSIGATVPNPTCGVDQSLGWVNGIPLCVNSSSTSTNTPPVTTTSTSTTETNASGVATTTTIDNSPSGGTTTTTVVVNPDGTSTTSTSTSTNPEASAMFCQQFPSDPSCAPQSDCDLNPDAIGCLDAGTPGDSLALGTQSISVGITPINFGIAAGCPADRQITVWGGGVVPIPLDQVCDFATMIKPLVLAMAWLAAGFIVFGSFKQG